MTVKTPRSDQATQQISSDTQRQDSAARVASLYPAPKHLGRASKCSILALVLSGLFVIGIAYECKTSFLQSYVLTKLAKRCTFELRPGKSNQTWYPDHGPYDNRLGYSKIPAITSYLTKHDFTIRKQAHLSPELLTLIENGVYPPYQEKTKSGLTILDRNNTTIYSAYRPEYMYENFQEIPEVVLKSLLFIENREILNQKYPFKNPAIEWDRFVKAILEKAKQIFNPAINAPGGSTIATQLQKYRHSREGRTHGIRDKLLQISSASMRSYLFGRDTSNSRRMFILEYINSIPLAALKNYGEVNGLGDGLWAWYGVSFERVNRSLSTLNKSSKEITANQARHFKQVLSLFLAHRRPSFYLLKGVSHLNTLTNNYLGLLAENGVISESLSNTAKTIPLRLKQSAPQPNRYSFVQRKAANAIRTRLLQLLKIQSLYDLDQVDLTVRSTIDNQATERVTRILKQLGDPSVVRTLGLGGYRNLANGDPANVVYSLTIFERKGTANLLRVQTDNYDNPFNINEGSRLDLGSTAKLRTLATYLDIISELHEEYRHKTSIELNAILSGQLDPISQFVARVFIRNKSVPLPDLLEVALNRRYSASPHETFFTGGGIHVFENFNAKDNTTRPTIKHALIHSINLPFVRLMRDISQHYAHRIKQEFGTKEEGESKAMRTHFLKKFAHQEGGEFVQSFFEKHRKKKPSSRLLKLVKNSNSSPRRASAIFRYARPDASLQSLKDFLGEALPTASAPNQLIEQWYHEFKPEAFSLNDQAFLARIHPLELWLIGYLERHPNAPLRHALKASKEIRQHAYSWLFNTSNTQAQDSRIKTLIEQESFERVLTQWQKLGYPFAYMVPSLASALGSSGDRPIALADLVGIIMNDGIKYPLVRLEEVHLASETPFDVSLTRSDTNSGVRVLRPEVARSLRNIMHEVVRSGTARRAFHAFQRSDGEYLLVGGKTGTGDHRFETYDQRGNVLTSKVMNRTATFTFWIGDRFFGVLSAHVAGEKASEYDFTSSLATQLLKSLAPALLPMLEQSGTQTAPPQFHLPTRNNPLIVDTAPLNSEPKSPSSAATSSSSRIIILAPPI